MTSVGSPFIVFLRKLVSFLRFDLIISYVYLTTLFTLPTILLTAPFLRYLFSLRQRYVFFFFKKKLFFYDSFFCSMVLWEGNGETKRRQDKDQPFY
jgi:hypothetical protein